MKIAFATRDRVHIDSHFGSAKKVDIYTVSKTGYTFLGTIEFGGNLNEDGDEDKLVPKVKALADCAIVYVSAIGGSAASRLLQNKITPIKAQSETDEIPDVLAELIKTLNTSPPPPWLRKVIQQEEGRDKNFDDFDDDE
ncbi:MAG: nitrogen fixation protein NifX [Microcoleaceae cyanobacterium]